LYTTRTRRLVSMLWLAKFMILIASRISTGGSGPWRP
jgi:hypothetical protein